MRAAFGTLLMMVTLAASNGFARRAAAWQFDPCPPAPGARCGPGPAVGETMPPIPGFGLDGKPLTITYSTSSTPTVIFVIAPFSAFVVANEKNVATIVTQRAENFRFVVLSPNPKNNGRLLEYIEKVRPGWGKVPVQVIADIPADLMQSLHFGGYPQTLVISPQSKVLKNFNGAFTNESVSAKPAEIEQFFGVKLPGLPPER